MDTKTLHTLEYPKILERLAGYCAFSASAEKARLLQPTSDILEARRRQAETREAVRLLTTHSDLSIGGARDVRTPVDLALHGGILTPGELLDIKYTLVSARSLARTFERIADAYPRLAEIAAQLPPPLGLIDAVSRAISDRGEIQDSASEKLSDIRRDLRVFHDRLMGKLQKLVGDPKNAPYLQEALITQRDGRYVVPLRAEFKGRIRSIVHDQSASGATLFVEPLAVVDLNNQYRELQLAERDEERRILTELSHQVGLHAYEITHTVEVIAELDLTLARAKFADDLRAVEPELLPLSSQPADISQQPTAVGSQIAKVTRPKSRIRLYQARHPLLDPQTVVPIDVELDATQANAPTYAMVITGPNTGGKTVALKTIGLLALMAQSGLHIPAQSGSEISLFENIFADIGDEQSIEQSLSTFSGHITNIIRILEHANPGCLVILDELGAGTDPQEGSALARALLAHLLERGITTLVTTHHPELKAFAHAAPGAINASVEFDLQTLRPTFHLTIGLPGRSNALAIAQRLGLPEAIITNARAELSPEDLRAEDLLNEIHQQRELARQARSAAELARKNAEGMRDELLERLEKIEDERRRLLEDARQEAQTELIDLNDEIAEIRKAMLRARQPVDALQAVEDKVEELAEEFEQPVERSTLSLPVKEAVIPPRPIRLGDKVRLRLPGGATSAVQGVVSALSQEEAEVQVGGLRVRARLAELQLATKETLPESKLQTETRRRTTGVEDQKSSASGRSTSGRATSFSLPESPGLELDLRGKTSEEALEAFERYLDAAYLAGLPFVRIIHGKGTGKLRDAVRRFLHGHPQVRSFEPGGEKEGGEGVTVVKLAN